MPVASDPSARRSYVLKADRGRPDQAPRFNFRYLTRRAKMAYLLLGRQDLAGLEPQSVFDRLYGHLAEVLTGWRGLTDPTGRVVNWPAAASEQATAEALAEALDAVLTDAEVWELYWAGASELDETDLGFSDSPPSSPPGGSANDAPRAGNAAADVPTPRRRKARTSASVRPATGPAAGPATTGAPRG